MKKLVFASVMALASLSLVVAPTLRAQDNRARFKSRIRPNSTPIKWQQRSLTPRPKPQLWKISCELSAKRGEKALLDMLIDTYQSCTIPTKRSAQPPACCRSTRTT